MPAEEPATDELTVTRNDAEAVEIFNRIARCTVGEKCVVDLPQPVMGGEDFAFYCEQVPSCFFVLGLIPPGKKSVPDLHQPDFDFNDNSIATGVEMFCRLALRDNDAEGRTAAARKR